MTKEKTGYFTARNKGIGEIEILLNGKVVITLDEVSDSFGTSIFLRLKRGVMVVKPRIKTPVVSIVIDHK
jgi:hypothetical protein